MMTPPSRPTPRSRWSAPFLWTEWGLSWTSYCCGRTAVFEVLEKVGKLTILCGVITYFVEAPARREQAKIAKKRSHYEAWQMINSARGEGGDGGRLDAIQDLHGDGVALLGFSAEKAYLKVLRVPGAGLRRAKLREADLAGVDFQNADLRGADLRNADLRGANFFGADLQGVDLSGADLRGARLDWVHDISADRIKVAAHWEEAICSPDIRAGLGLAPHASAPVRPFPSVEAPAKVLPIPGPVPRISPPIAAKPAAPAVPGRATPVAPPAVGGIGPAEPDVDREGHTTSRPSAAAPKSVR